MQKYVVELEAQNNAPARTDSSSKLALLTAAEDVIKRWDSPDWKDSSTTAKYIEQLRTAVNNVKGYL